MSSITNLKERRFGLDTITALAERIDARVEAARLPAWTVVVAAAALGIWALRLYSRADLTLAYPDAVAHLNIARQVIDSVTPSFSQLGGVWLPLPHVLMLPTIWNDTMWHTGLSGSLVSLLAFALSTAYAYKLIHAVTQHGLAAIIGSALFATNANMLYMQSTPMAETLTIFLIIAATYHLVRWTQGASLVHFVVSACFVMAATLTRYETWILVPAGTAVVAATAFHRKRALSHAEGYALAWGMLAAYGIFLWLLYNQIIFGDIRYFSSGPGAATAFANEAEANGLLPTKHDLAMSASVFGWSVIDNVGLPVAVAAVVGSVFLILSRMELPVKLAILLPLSIAVFHIASLTAGQSVIWSPHEAPHFFYNTRYGLVMLPAAVIAACYLARPLRMAGLLMLVAALLPQLLALPSLAQGNAEVQIEAHAEEARDFARTWVGANYPLFRAGHQITLAEVSTPDFDRDESGQAAEWLDKSAREGRILISQQAAAALMFNSNLPLSHFISEGNKPFFPEELESPGRHARWIVYQPDNPFDALHSLMEGGPPASFKLAFEAGGFQIFQHSTTDNVAAEARLTQCLPIGVINGLVAPPVHPFWCDAAIAAPSVDSSNAEHQSMREIQLAGAATVNSSESAGATVPGGPSTLISSDSSGSTVPGRPLGSAVGAAPPTGIGSLAPTTSSVPAWAVVAAVLGGAGVLGVPGTWLARTFRRRGRSPYHPAQNVARNIHS